MCLIILLLNEQVNKSQGSKLEKNAQRCLPKGQGRKEKESMLFIIPDHASECVKEGVS